MARREEPQQQQEEAVRLDKWLWAARFFKTRAMATEAISGGHVHLNGARVKPARPVRIGDMLLIRKAQLTFEVAVRGISSRRGPASIAQELYEETEASRQRREEERQQRQMAAAEAPHPVKRPDKRSRRRIIRFNEKGR